MHRISRIPNLAACFTGLALAVFLAVGPCAEAYAGAVTWTGATSTEWNTGSNWSSGTTPDGSDDCTIPANVASGQYPVISAFAAIAHKIILGSGAGTQPTLSIANNVTCGADFKINAGTVTMTAGTFTVGSGGVDITGTFTLSGGTFLSEVNLEVFSGGVINVSGSAVLHMADATSTTPSDNITINAGGSINLSGGSIATKDFTTESGSPGGTLTQTGGTFKMYKDFKNSGVYTATAGTIEFGGNGGFNAPGTNQFYDVQVNNGVTTDFASSLAASILVRGNWTNNGTVDLTGKATTVTFNGSGAQSIGGSTSTTFRNIVVNKSAESVTLALNSAVTSGDLTVTAGTLDLSSYTMNRSAAGGTITVSNGATLRIGGTNSFPSNYTTHTLGATSTVEYYGANQAVTDEDYGHLTLSGSGTKTMPATTVTVAGNFLMSGTCVATAAAATNTAGNFTVGTSNAFTTGSFTHDIDGNFTNNGTFTATGSTITLTNTSSDQTINGTTTTTFNNLTIAKSATKVTLSTSANVGGTLTFTSGNISTGSNTLAITSTGSVSRTSGHVIGNLQKNVATGANVSRTFEIGSTSSYTPLTAVFASVSVAGNLTCSTTDGDHANIATSDVNVSKSVNRYWTMTNSGITFTTHSTTFTFVAGDIDGGANTATFIARRWNGSAWSTTTAGTRTATTTQITSEAGLGDFQVGNILSVAASTSTFAFGTQPLNTWLTAQSSVITNDGTETEAIVAKISTFTTGSNNWTLSAAANGADQVRAQWSTTSDSGPWTNISAYDTNFTVTGSLAASGTLTFYLRVQTPTSTSSLSQYSSTLTLTAQ